MSSVPIGSRLGAWGNAEASLSGFYIYIYMTLRPNAEATLADV